LTASGLQFLIPSACVIINRCGPCQNIAPVFEALARQHHNIVFLKVDVDKVPSIKKTLGVWAMPTFAFLKKGRKVGSFMGANEKMLRRGLEHDGHVGIWNTREKADYSTFSVSTPHIRGVPRN
jgi:thioredoxin 1